MPRTVPKMVAGTACGAIMPGNKQMNNNRGRNENAECIGLPFPCTHGVPRWLRTQAHKRSLPFAALNRRDGAPQAAGLKSAVECRLNWALERGERRRTLAERGRAPGGGAVGPADGQRRGRGHGERGCRI